MLFEAWCLLFPNRPISYVNGAQGSSCFISWTYAATAPTCMPRSMSGQLWSIVPLPISRIIKIACTARPRRSQLEAWSTPTKTLICQCHFFDLPFFALLPPKKTSGLIIQRDMENKSSSSDEGQFGIPWGLFPQRKFAQLIQTNIISQYLSIWFCKLVFSV